MAVIFLSLDLGGEADRPLGRIGRRHQLADGVEHGLEVGVVLALQGIQSGCQLLVFGEYLAQADKGAHDFDIDLDGAVAAQDA